VATEVFLHVGPPKTGTTYLQSVLWKNRRLLREQGLFVPGPAPVSQFHAVVDLTERDVSGLGGATSGAWAEMVRKIAQWQRRAVVSHENLGFATPAQVARARADLADADLHVVFTARALTAVAPAAWQERLKNRGTQRWSDFVDELVAPSAEVSPFWHQHAGGALTTWAEGLPPDRVHVVTVPPSAADPQLLWQRFAGVLGVDPGSCSTDVPRSNESLGVDEAAYLRAFNEGPGAGLDWSTYRAGVKHGLATVLARRPDKRRIRATGEDATALLGRADELAARVSAAGYDVVGDLADLRDESAAAEDTQDNDTAAPDALDRSAHTAVLGFTHEVAALGQRHRAEVDALRDEIRAQRILIGELREQVEAGRAVAERLRQAEQRLALPAWRLAAHRVADGSPMADRARRAVRRLRPGRR
jgi:hypothetical protein